MTLWSGTEKIQEVPCIMVSTILNQSFVIRHKVEKTKMPWWHVRVVINRLVIEYTMENMSVNQLAFQT